MNVRVIDFHSHVGRWGLQGFYDDPKRFLRIMDAAGVDQSCVNCIFYGDAKRGNDRVFEFVNEHPTRFIPVAYVTPRYPTEAIKELDRSFDKLGMKFLKIYPDYLRKPVDDPSYSPIYEWANDRGIVIMSHTMYVSETDPQYASEYTSAILTRPLRFIKLAEKFPRIQWVLAHSGNTIIGQEEAVEAAKAQPNIYLETCTSLGAEGTIEFLVDGAGADRVLFGSDMPLLDARQQLGRIVTANISTEAKTKILGLNAIKLLNLET